MLEEFCQDLKSYLEETLRRRRTHVVVRVGRLAKLRGELQKRISPYSAYLRRLFSEYKFAKGTYILPREKAEDVYKNLDKLCEELKKPRRRRIKINMKKEKMALVTIRIPSYMLRDLDEAVKVIGGKKRAEIIREAIQRVLDRKVCIVLTPEEKNMLEELVRRGVYRNIEDAIRDAVHQLVQRLNLSVFADQRI
jgi:Arc/MetJ-type ribon-helix-helix transcriptional regulator